MNAPADFAKDFTTNPGKVVTCEEAFAYRDGPLFDGFQILASAGSPSDHGISVSTISVPAGRCTKPFVSIARLVAAKIPASRSAIAR